MTEAFREEISTKIADKFVGVIMYFGILACILDNISSNAKKNKNRRLTFKKPSNVNLDRHQTFPQNFVSKRSIKTMYTVDDIIAIMKLLSPPVAESDADLNQQVIDIIRFCLTREFISSSDVNIYGKFFGDDDRDKISLIALAKIAKCNSSVVPLPKELLLEAQKYQEIIDLGKDENEKGEYKTDFMKLIDIMRLRLHNIIDKGDVSNEVLIEKMLEQPECIGSYEIQKKLFHIFKIDNNKIPISGSLMEEAIVPILKGSKLFYQNTKILKCIE